MKFSAHVVRGKRAERTAAFPMLGKEGTPVDVPVLLVPLSGTEEAEAMRFAVEYAKSKGSADPKPFDPLYDLAYTARVLTWGVLDADSPPAAREPFFASPAEVLDDVPREHRIYLFELHQAWQEETSPSVRTMTADEMVAAARVLAGGGTDAERFLDQLSSALQRSCLRTMGALFWSLLEAKSPTGSPSTEGTTTSRPNSESAPSEKKPTA